MSQQIDALIDVAKLETFLRGKLPAQDGDLTVEKHQAGFSNETFYVSWGPKQWVLRRPPRGDILPTAHDMLREFRVLSGLAATGVRVPRPVVACEDLAVIGAPFYLMERLAGVVIREQLPPEFDAMSDRKRIGEELIDALAELHAVRWQETALATLGKPEGFLPRQLRRWAGQLELTLPRTRPLPGLQEVSEWLTAHLPEQSATSIVHGDYKLDNVMFTPHPAKLVAIFDWEMATLGDPLADLGWVMTYWGPTGDPPEPEPKESNHITSQPGFHSREELVARYEEKTGRTMKHFAFYHCLAVWKLAIILEGLYRHYIEGTASNPKANEFEWKVPQLVDRAHRIMAGAA
ncbi:MAG: phosphotransferase family protein [Deltaproteobacteria bacterium]|nr:phosphotransferase family protein [Deltaproteobacteria bacterium]